MTYTSAGYPTDLPPTSYVPPDRSRGTNGFAIASLVLGLVGGVLLSVVFGIVALVQIRRRGQRGRRLAIAGITLSSLWIIVVAIVITLASMTAAERERTGQVGGGGSLVVEEQVAESLRR